MGKPERVRQAEASHQAALARTIDRMSMSGMRSEFDIGMAGLGKALVRGFRGRGRDPVTEATIGEISRVAASGIVYAYRGVAGVLADQTRDVTIESVRRLGRFLGLVDETAGPLDEPRQVQRVAGLRRDAMQRLRMTSMASAGARADAVIRARLALLETGKATVGEAITDVLDTADTQWWQVERVARTETSYAYNAAQEDGIREISQDVPGLMKRWTERVSDVTGAPLDQKVGPDSVLMHGQVAGPSALFYMPASSTTPRRMQGASWTAPPNRPNDRAVLTPWRATWGTPGWTFQDGRRVDIGTP